MDLRKLEVFCKVYELKSFSRAGKACLLSQPTVSEHIRHLETHLDVRLFDRLGREVVPTRAGGILYKYARRMLNLKREAGQTLERYRGKCLVIWSWAVAPYPASTFFPPSSAASGKTFPIFS